MSRHARRLPRHLPGVDPNRYGHGDAYVPMVRPGAGRQWPPSPNWSYHDLIAEMNFWRAYSALRAFSGGRSNVDSPTVPIPAQRRPHEDRWAAFLKSSYGTARHGQPLAGAAAESVRRKGLPRA